MHFNFTKFCFTKIAVESIENIRTVATLAKERMFHDEYTAATGIPYR